jgi:hypothetical protein
MTADGNLLKGIAENSNRSEQTKDQRFRDLIAAIRKHQARGDFHPLTCGYDSTHRPLDAYVENGERVRLMCHDCAWTQDLPRSLISTVELTAAVVPEPPRRGSWVRWCRNGELVIAEVAYVRKQERYPWDVELVTDRGLVAQDVVIEVRHAAVGGAS